MEYNMTTKIRFHILKHFSKWVPYVMSQKQCMEVGFLSGDRGDYFCYNNTVQRCGDVIKFENNCLTDSSVGTKYAFLP
jgi:hypothetical protein